MTTETTYAVFDRATGEVLFIWELFAVPEEEARSTLLDFWTQWIECERADVDAALRPEMIGWTQHGLSEEFSAGSLPGMEHAWLADIEYVELENILHSWAIPEELTATE